MTTLSVDDLRFMYHLAVKEAGRASRSEHELKIRAAQFEEQANVTLASIREREGKITERVILVLQDAANKLDVGPSPAWFRETARSLEEAVTPPKSA